MPLHISYKSYDRPEVQFRHQMLVEAGQAIAIPKSESLGGFVVARCMEPDMGAEVFMVEESYEGVNQSLIIPCVETEPYARILAGLCMNVDILDKDDEAMRLIFQHIMPNGEVNSLN